LETLKQTSSRNINKDTNLIAAAFSQLWQKSDTYESFYSRYHDFRYVNSHLKLKRPTKTRQGANPTRNGRNCVGETPLFIKLNAGVLNLFNKSKINCTIL